MKEFNAAVKSNHNGSWLAALFASFGCGGFLLALLVKLGFWAVIIWAIIELVQHLTA